jgi:hypothetical protein
MAISLFNESKLAKTTQLSNQPADAEAGFAGYQIP